MHKLLCLFRVKFVYVNFLNHTNEKTIHSYAADDRPGRHIACAGTA